jgi:hypothetical protein
VQKTTSLSFLKFRKEKVQSLLIIPLTQICPKPFNPVIRLQRVEFNDHPSSPNPTSLSGYDLNSLGPLCRPHHIDYIESPPLHTVDLTFNCLPIQKGGGMGEGGH